MISVDDLQKIVEVALFSGRLKGERPLSLLIIAKVGAGKSDIIAHYPEATVSKIIYANDITAFSLHKRHGMELKQGKIRHIIMPDLLTPLNKAKEQADAFITFMNGIIEEGLARVESRDSDFKAEFPVKVGFITSIAKGDFERRLEKWATVGFLSRMLPISYGYKQETIEKILDYIMLGEYHSDKPVRLHLPEKDVEIVVPLPIAEELKSIAKEIKDPEDEVAGRRLKQLRTFVMGHALYCKRTMVDERDLVALLKLKKYMNRDCKYKI